MAIRRITADDIPVLVTWWNAHKTANSEYASEPPVPTALLLSVLSDPNQVMLVDPVTQTLAFGFIDGTIGHLKLLITRTANTAAAVTATDRMFKAVANGAIARGVTSLFGEYTFPVGVNVELTRAIRYFNFFVPPCVKTKTVNPDGTTTVHFEVDPVLLLPKIVTRTP